MAKTSVETEAPQDTAVLDRMADILEQLQKNAPPNEPGFGHPEYQKRLREEGFFADFAAKVFQNGKEAQARGLKPETVDRATKLRAGKYLGGRVEVARDGRDQVHLLYPHAKVQDQIKNAQLFPNFDVLIEKIWTEMHAS